MILKISRFEDGTVQEVAMDNGLLSETYYRTHPPQENAENQYTNDFFKYPQKKVEVKLNLGRLITIFGYYVLYTLLLVLIILSIDSRFVSPPYISALGKVMPAKVILKDYASGRGSCDDGIFCRVYYSLPVLNTTNGSIYPNFTKSDGSPGDYSKALYKLAALMTNRSCANLTLSTGINTYVNGSNLYYGLLYETVIESLFLLQQDCSSDALYAVEHSYRFEKYGISLRDYTELPDSSGCGEPWEAVLGTYVPRPPPKPCTLVDPLPEIFETVTLVNVQ